MSTPKRNKGRPRKPTAERRDKQIHVRATAAELAAWEEVAKREGRTVTNLARHLLNTAVPLALAFAVLALSSCAPGRGVLLVTVAAAPDVAAAIAALDVGVERAGVVAASPRLLVPVGAALRFSLSFTPEERGDVTVVVAASDAAGARLAQGTAAATVVPSRVVDVAVTLGDERAPPPDLGELVDLTPAVDLEAACDLAGPCGTTLADVGAGDFAIAFRVTAAAAATTRTLLYQRDGHCGHGLFWEADLQSDGRIFVATDDGTPDGYTALISAVGVADARPHSVRVTRAAGTLAIAIDDAPSGAAASAAVLGALPPLGIGSGNPCEGSTMTALVGAVTDVCLSRPCER